MVNSFNLKLRKEYVAFSMLVIASGTWLLAGTLLPSKAVAASPKPKGCACEGLAQIPNFGRCAAFVEVSTGDSLKITPVGLPSGMKVNLVATIGEVVDGKYIAPTAVPPSGVDDIEIQNETGEPMGRILLQVNAGGSPTVTPQAVTSNASLAAMDLDEEYPATQIADVTVVEPVNLPLQNLAPLTTTTVGGVTGQITPVIDMDSSLGSSAKFLIVGGPTRVAGSKCGMNPKPVWAGKNCSPDGAEKSVDSKPKSFLKDPISTITGPYSVSANGTIGPVTAGGGITITGSYKNRPAVSVFYKDIYRCSGGQWKYAYTKKCVKWGGFGWLFDPPALSTFLGYPGDPSYKFGNGQYVCTRQ